MLVTVGTYIESWGLSPKDCKLRLLRGDTREEVAVSFAKGFRAA